MDERLVEEIIRLNDSHRQWVSDQFDAKDERIRTLEDALRPFAQEAKREHTPSHGWRRCYVCKVWPCKYETARRALEGQP